MYIGFLIALMVDERKKIFVRLNFLISTKFISFAVGHIRMLETAKTYHTLVRILTFGLMASMLWVNVASSILSLAFEFELDRLHMLLDMDSQEEEQETKQFEDDKVKSPTRPSNQIGKADLKRSYYHAYQISNSWQDIITPPPERNFQSV